MRACKLFSALLAALLVAASASSRAQDTLRLLTWGSYAPENVIERFE